MSNYHVVIEGKAVGPYNVDQLLALGINGETLVWYEGLPNWVAASSVPEINTRLQSTVLDQIPVVPPTPQPTPDPTPRPNRVTDGRPNNNLAFAIISLILFFPLGIPAFIKSRQVDPLWNNGHHEEAKRTAQTVHTLGLIGIIIGAIFQTFLLVALAAA